MLCVIADNWKKTAAVGIGNWFRRVQKIKGITNSTPKCRWTSFKLPLKKWSTQIAFLRGGRTCIPSEWVYACIPHFPIGRTHGDSCRNWLGPPYMLHFDCTIFFTTIFRFTKSMKYGDLHKLFSQTGPYITYVGRAKRKLHIQIRTCVVHYIVHQGL